LVELVISGVGLIVMVVGVCGCMVVAIGLMVSLFGWGGMLVGVVVGRSKMGGSEPRTRGFVWASKREGENRHTETRSNFGVFCLARVRGLVREGLVYNRACFGGFLGSGGCLVGFEVGWCR